MSAAEGPPPVLVAAPASGPRYAVRHRLPDGSATDVVGPIVAEDAEARWILPEDRGPVRVARVDVVAVRRVPPRRVRPASSADDLERLTARGWPGTETARLGGWLLRAGGGWTRRANSCLVTGDPGVGLAAAVSLVGRWYAARGSPGLAQVPLAAAGAAADTAFADAGWRAAQESEVLTAELRRLPVAVDDTPAAVDDALIAVDDADAHPPQPAAPDPDGGRAGARTAPPPAESVWARAPSESWLGVLRGGSARGVPAAAAVLTAVPAHYLTFRRGGRAVAVGRVVVTDDWCGIAAVEVVPDERRRGLGRRVTAELLERGRAEGARFAYVQVGSAGPAALRLYAGLGFAEHHRYHYRCAPQ